MKARTLLLTVSLASPLALSAADDYSYKTSSRVTRQSADEVEDIGEINEDKGTAGFTKSKFRASVTAREQYTTNARLSGNHSSGDYIFLPTLDIGYSTDLGQYFHFDIAGKLESAIYGRYDDRSFYGYSALATLDFRPSENSPRLYVGAEPYRYVSYDTGDRITQALGLSVGTDWGRSFNAGRSLLYAGYSFTVFLADPDEDDRTQHTIVLGLAHSFTARLTGQIYYSWQYSDFDIDRRDSRHIVGGSLIYQFADRWFGSATTSFVDSDSTQDRSSYQSFGASLGLTKEF
jgi:hypothetical protein